MGKTTLKVIRHFGRVGWWQTLCGADQAQVSAWTTNPKAVTCMDCWHMVQMGDHKKRPVGQLMVKVATVGSGKDFEADVAHAFCRVLGALERYSGISMDGPNFKETCQRVARSYSEIFAGMFNADEKRKEILSKTFPSKSREMITVGPVEVWSMCPHHFLPVHLHIWVAYIPNGKVLGLSKLARLAELVAKKPALQEDTTMEIAQMLHKGLRPKGAACYVRGRHLCMEMRGIKKNAVTTTTALQGTFFRPEVREEFLAAVRGDK